jgi:hypothetical protein
VAFLDVLGFETLVRSGKRKDRAKIEKYFQSVNAEISELKSLKIKERVGFLVISDSVILAVRKSDRTEDNIENLRQLCIAIQKIQFRLALENIWIRGAISSGEAYFSEDNGQIVGQAFINAYQLEKRIAVYPRVILDSRLISELMFTSAQDMISAINCEVLYPWNNHSRVYANIEKDVSLFINYLKPALETPSHLMQIIENIKLNIYSNAEYYLKYRWVTDYLFSLLIPLSKFDHSAQAIMTEKLLLLEDL